jgi:hypothetical protein
MLVELLNGSVNITVYDSPTLIRIAIRSLHVLVNGGAFHNGAAWDLMSSAWALIRNYRCSRLIQADIFLSAVHLEKFHAHVDVRNGLILCVLGIKGIRLISKR